MADYSLDVVALLQKTVSFNTVNRAISGNPRPESELVTFLEETAAEHNLVTKRLPVPDRADNLLVLYERDPALPWLLFDSHLDTVAVEGMIIDPFAAEIRDGRLWGRGACDTKGTGAAMFTALATYSARNEGQSNNVALLFSVDEEWGMGGIRAFISDHYPSLGFFAKGAVVGEPTGLLPVVAHNGVVRYVIITHGKAAHSSDPSMGKSAISTMARLVTYLETEFIPGCNAFHELTGSAQCSINVIRGGVVANIIPERCEIHIDRRIVPGETSSGVKREMNDAIAVFLKNYSDEKIDVEVSIDTPALDPGDETDGEGFADSVLHALGSIGRPGSGVGVKYATHAGELSAAGIPSVVLGPGDIAQGHTNDEWIDIEELRKGVEIYSGLMARA